ncbi:solute carrier family 15 member 1 [Trichosurus vulpecula]|uniref:solute carrier family 15 member 1 n=1 Tax=Trichosurus vulpecula TaxID=9337 RepID=UPI00186B380B|nr:solute carrier family 15 member 1 [Trichosurus vulpecula]
MTRLWSDKGKLARFPNLSFQMFSFILHLTVEAQQSYYSELILRSSDPSPPAVTASPLQYMKLKRRIQLSAKSELSPGLVGTFFTGQPRSPHRPTLLHSLLPPNMPMSPTSFKKSSFAPTIPVSNYYVPAILVLYFQRFLGWEDNLSTAIYHTFVALCYLTPILGALIADSWLGKFKTIISLSIVYALGQVVIAISSINDLSDANRDGQPDSIALHVTLAMVGLVLIAFGTGGIKPCVSAFGGDQFEENQEKQRNRFFSIFYLAINAGSLISTIVTPILRVQECGIHSKQACYPLAFGVPAALMAISLFVFIIGSSMYKKVRPQGNILSKVANCIGFAIKNRFNHRSREFPKREHWLDWAKEKYDERLITQIKMVTRVLLLYIPLPMFWALFDQQGSRWTLQATTMNGNFGAIEIQPDQMQTVNAILIVIMVPIVDAVVYPLIAKCGLNFTALRKMTTGMFLASMAFVAAAIVQLEIEKTLPVFPTSNEIQVQVLNVGNEPLYVSFPGHGMDLQVNQSSGFQTLEASIPPNINITYGQQHYTIPNNFEEGYRHSILAWDINNIVVLRDSIKSKPEKGENGIRFANALNETITVSMDEALYENITSYNASDYKFLPSGIKLIRVLGRCESPSPRLEFGSAYTYVITKCDANGLEFKSFVDVPPNTINMALQIPQYFLLTCGEVVFSVTGLEFSYSQSPSNMKSVLQAGWLLTVAFGNIIVLIVAGAGQFSKQWAEYILFAALLLVVCFIFAIMAYYYTYVNPAEIEAQFDAEDEKKKKLGKIGGVSDAYEKPNSFSQTAM